MTVVNRNISQERTLEILLPHSNSSDKAHVRFLVPRAVRFDEGIFDQHDEQVSIATDDRLTIKLSEGCIARIELSVPGR